MGKTYELYNEDDLKVMKLAKSYGKDGVTRVEEIKLYAKNAGYKKLGIAYCISVSNFAKQLEDYLSDCFEVVAVSCKHDRLPNEKFIEGKGGISCNPVGQAQVLSDAQTELNIALGLCLGHDILFAEKTTAPLTTLIVKDRPNDHNTLAGFSSI